MPTLNEIKTHIHAIEQTRQITNAMYLLSASKMKQTIQRADYNVRYMQRLRATMKDIALHSSEDIHHPYIDAKESPHSALFIIVSSDKGLCGGYNNNLLSFAEKCLAQYKGEYKTALLGLVGEEYFERHGIKPDFLWRGVIQNPTLYNANVLAETVLDEYNSGNADEVYVIFTSYKNPMSQNPEMIKLLPLAVDSSDDIQLEFEYSTEIMFDPSPSEVIGKVIPQYIISMLFNTLIQSSAAEHASRMNSMQTATSNADEMLEKLHSDYNMLRQLSITNEITEISATTQTLESKSV